MTGTNAQTNIINTNPVSQQIIIGNYNPNDYQAATVLNDHAVIVQGINIEVSSDSIRKYLEALATFGNRNTFSDTVSSTRGIGAASRWVYQKFQEFSITHDNRLVPSYLQFDQTIVTNSCTISSRYKNIMAVLPGSDTSDKSIIIIQGHIDSRCAGLCDTACVAQGEEDNGSGTVLVMELARVMSKYTFKNTIVFAVLTGEEQGLFGGNALATYCINNNVKVKAVLNNDIVGGILCGYTASASGDPLYPACSAYGNIDSTHVRLFSYGGFNSFHKGWARFVKLEYKEELLPYVTIPTGINILTSEDRTGRGGDHIPFRMKGYTALRVTAANENGNALNANDRQHTSRDILGDDLNSDGILDTFYVDFHYLSRNIAINGTAAAMAAIGPQSPDSLIATSAGGNSISIQIVTGKLYPQYRVGLRTVTNDFDTVFTITGTLTDTVTASTAGPYFLSVATVDSNGVESLFSKETSLNVTGINENSGYLKGIFLMPNYPNPSDEATNITVFVEKPLAYKDAYISICNMTGREIQRLPVALQGGVNETLYEHGYNMAGTYLCSLIIDGKTVQTQRMVFAE